MAHIKAGFPYIVGSLVILFVTGCSNSCNRANMSSRNKLEAKKEDPTPPPTPSPTPSPTLPPLDPCIFNENQVPGSSAIRNCPAEITVGVKSLQQEAIRHAWTVTQAGSVTYYEIENKTVKSTKQWTGALSPTGGGARTYVIEGGGLVIARTGGHLYFVHPGMAGGGNLTTLGAPHYIKLSMPAPYALNDANDRLCLVSYMRAGMRYIGFGYGNGHFAEVPLADTPPFTPRWSQAAYKGSGLRPGIPSTTAWGYSCFIDQRRMIYYGAWVHHTNRMAINLINFQPVDPAVTAPNGTFVSSDIPYATLGPKSGQIGSYAISGDPEGNVLSGAGGPSWGASPDTTYTMSYEPQNKTVWRTPFSKDKIEVFAAKCLTTQTTCGATNRISVPLTGALSDLAGLGPISALGDGSLLGVTRSPPHAVFRLELKNPGDLSKGITATKLGSLNGDPYMYTDFTGATLYLNQTNQSFLFSGGEFKLDKPLRTIGFTWQNRDGGSASWVDVQMEMRCYPGAANPKPDFEIVTSPISSSGEQSFISTPRCAEGLTRFDTVDIRLTQLNGKKNLMNIEKIQVSVYQLK